MFEPSITMTRGGTVTRCSEAELRRLAAEFDRCHCVRVSRMLESDLLSELRARVDQSAFLERVHEGIDANSELCLSDDSVCGILQFIFNSRELFRFVQSIAGCERIGCFEGRVYRVVPGAGHHDAWHDDMGEHRMIAMSVNLGGDFQGGALQIREREYQRIVHEVANTGPGDAIFFRIDGRLQHRITDIEGNAPKTAFAGWFRSQPDFASIVNPGKFVSCPGASK